MSTYKLTYWNVRGRAEPIRILFAAAKVNYEDVRISRESWSSLKGSMPWGQIPVLEVDGKTLSQSMTICRYLAKKYGFIGSNEWETAKCDEYVDAVMDLVSEMKKIAHAPNEQMKAERKSAFLSQTVPSFLKKFEEIVKANGGSFLLGDKITWADMVLTTTLERLEIDAYAGSSLLEVYPKLKVLRNSVCSYPGIKEWMEARPKE